MKIRDIEMEIIEADITKTDAGLIVNPDSDSLTSEENIRLAMQKALDFAQTKNIESVAFSGLGCGASGFDPKASAKIMSQEVFRLIRNNRSSKIRRVIFVLGDKKSKEIFKRIVFGYLEYITKKIEEGPFVTVDLIIEIDSKIVIIQRSNPPFGWALPGGFVDYGESLEHAAEREAKEETSLDTSKIKQFHTYSQANRDPRFHTVSTVFTAFGKGKPKAASDAKDIRLISKEELDKIDFAFDHKKIIEDYFRSKQD